ncbi:hypothetical protein D3C72_1402060 [compost metagenome]
MFGFAQAAEQAAHQQPVQRKRAHRLDRHGNKAITFQFTRLDADVFQLQFVVAHHQRRRAQVADATLFFQLQSQLARRAQQGDQP